MENYVRWNAPNWITVLLMVLIAHAILGFTYSVVTGMGKASDD